MYYNMMGNYYYGMMGGGYGFLGAVLDWLNFLAASVLLVLGIVALWKYIKKP